MLLTLHERNKVQDTKEALPRLPFHVTERSKGETTGEGTGKDGRCECAKVAQLLSHLRGHAFGEGDEGGTIALRVPDKADLVIARLFADVIDEGWQVVDCELADVIIPKARIATAVLPVAHVKDATIVTEEDLIPAVLGKPECQTTLFRGDKGPRGLEEAMHDQDGVSSCARWRSISKV